MKKLFKISVRFVGIIIFIVIIYGADWDMMGKVVKGMDYIFILPIVILICFKNLVISYRWHFLLNSYSIKRKYWDNIKLYFSGLLLGYITPGHVGEFYRLVKLNKEGHSKIKGAFILLLSKFFDVALIFVLSIIGGIYLINYSEAAFGFVPWILFIGITLLTGLYALFLISKYGGGRLVVSVINKLMKTKLDDEALISTLGVVNLKISAKTAVLTTAFWLLYFLQLHIAARAIGIEINYITATPVLALVSMAAALPITVVGMGTRELAMMNCLSILGVEKERALVLSFMVYGIILINLLISAVLWNLEHK